MVAKIPGRNEALFADFTNGATYAELQEKYGISSARVGQIIASERAKIPLRDRQAIVQDMTAQLDAMRVKAEAIVHAPPVVALTSKGDIVPSFGENGRPDYSRPAQDHSASLAAMDTVVRIQARESRLLGLDQPTQAKVESSMEITMKGMEGV